MAEPKSPGLKDDTFGTVHEFASWDEFFQDCIRLHDRGVPYSLLAPDAGTLARLGPMPTPPWAEMPPLSSKEEGPQSNS